ncbi:MAG: VOC family protein [Neisseriaceae bacterium]|nr:VOC family protein [Neisseriaceae bacterium]
MKPLRIDHWVLICQNLDKTLDFYCNILGLRHECKNGHHSVHLGEQKINIHTQQGEFTPFAKNPQIGCEDFCLIADGNIHDIKNELKNKGITLETDIVERNGALGKIDSIYLRDPDGNLVEIAVYR